MTALDRDVRRGLLIGGISLLIIGLYPDGDTGWRFIADGTALLLAGALWRASA